MAEVNPGILEKFTKADEMLYEKLTQFDRFSRQGLGEALVRGTRGTLKGAAHGLGDLVGLGYMSRGIQHYSKAASGAFRPKMPIRQPIAEWDKYFNRIHPSLGPSRIAPYTAVEKATARMGAIGRRGVSGAGVLMRGMMPAFAVYGATEDEMGFGIGLAKQMAGWSMFGPGAKFGMNLGGWAAARTGISAGGAVGKIPGIKKVAATAVGRFAGAAVGGSIGWLLGGFIAMEAVAWTVGFAIHTLPTFAKQYKSDMSSSGYGGDYKDSAGAATMRQRSLQVMGKSFVNARSALGQEASLLHV
jgi:hypothetical protein